MSYNVAPNPFDNGNSTTPIGAMFLWGSSVIPTGYFACDGTAVSRSTYASLYSVLGTTYGVGDGTTTFNLPNTSGRVVRGTSGGYPLGASGGADTNTQTGTQSLTVTSANLPPHRHQQARGGGINIISSGSTQVQGTSDNTGSDGQTQPNATYQENGSTLVANTPLAVSVPITTNVVNPYVSINYIIRAT